MTSGIGSTSRSGVSGLVSGMDTDALVKAALARETAKIQKYESKIQVDEWKTDAYREITSSLQSLYSTYFDSTSSTNLKSANSFAGFSTSYGTASSSNYVTMTGLSGANAGTYTISEIKAATHANLTGGALPLPVGGTVNIGGGITSANNVLSITLNGTTKQITITEGTAADQIGTKIQEQIDSAFGGTNRIKVTHDTGTGAISFEPKYSDTDIFSIGASSSALSVIGLTSASNLSNKVDLNTNISEMDNVLGTAFSGSEGDIAFSINGTEFSFNSATTSIQDIIDEVNSNTDINVTMKYDLTANSFSIKSNSTGQTKSIVVADTTGNLMTTLGVSGTANGTDASITVNGKTIVRESNAFTYDGISYDIKQDLSAAADDITATINADTTKTYGFIKGFVDKYNEVIAKISEKMNEEKFRNYTPLTDEQRESMTDDQIEKWEAKAKSGLLRNDSILSGILSKLRSTVYDTVEGAGISLSSIGITTSADYTQKGKLEINETKLKQSLATKSEQITRLFTNASDKTYYESINSSTLRSERYEESGIAQRLSDVIQDAIRTNTDADGVKGSLLEKAGIKGDRSQYTNILYKEMKGFSDMVDDLNKKLSDKENALYAKYSAMESALSKLNEQQSYITSMLGGS